MTAVLALSVGRVVPAKPRAEHRQVVLRGIPWETYTAIRESLRDRKIFLTYDRGVLEIMVLSAGTRGSRACGQRSSVCTPAISASLTRASARSRSSAKTWKRVSRTTGVENDECFYIESLPK